MSASASAHSAKPVAEDGDNNNNLSMIPFTRVSPDRKYTIAFDRLHGTRLWVECSSSSETRDNYNLYTFAERQNGDDIYKCTQCKRYEKSREFCSVIKVRKLENGEEQLWEKIDHYESCAAPVAMIEEIHDKYHHLPGTPYFRLQGATVAEIRATPRSQTKTTLWAKESRNQPSASRSQSVAASRKRRSADRDLVDIATSHQPLLPKRSRPSTSNATAPASSSRALGTPVVPKLALPTIGLSASSFISAAAVISRALAGLSRAHASTSNTTAAVASTTTTAKVGRPKSRPSTAAVKTPPLPSSSSATTHVAGKVGRPRIHPLPDTVKVTTHKPNTSQLSQQQQSRNIKRTQEYDPKLLKNGESFLHCLPSSAKLRRMNALLNLEYEPKNQLFWHSTVYVNEITSSTTADTVENLTASKNMGFEALSMVFTNSEDSALTIQKSIKRYIFNHFWNKDTSNLDPISNALCGAELQSIHLWALTKMAKIRIAVFSDDRGIELYGDAFNPSLPSMLLQKDADGYWPIISVEG